MADTLKVISEDRDAPHTLGEGIFRSFVPFVFVFVVVENFIKEIVGFLGQRLVFAYNLWLMLVELFLMCVHVVVFE